MHHANMLAYILLTLLGWPSGILLGNLLANFVWLPIQYLGLHLKMAAHHAAVHGRLDEQDTMLAAIVDHLGLERPSSGSDLPPGDGNL
jgi:hypothetical protein